MTGRFIFALNAFIAFVAFIAASPSPSPLPSPTPGAHASASPQAAPTRGMAAPTPSLPDTSPFGQIGKLERNRKTLPAQLEPFLKSSDPAIAARAALALGRLRNPAAVALLTPLLGADHPDEVRAAAAFALGVIASADALPALRSAAVHAPPAVAGAAADSLGRIGGGSAVETLSGLVSARDSFVRGKAAIGLGEAGFASKPQISQPLKATTAKLLDNAFVVEHDQEVRWRMAWAIYRSYFDTNPGLLRTMLADQQELVRLYAVKAIGRLKDKTFVTPVRLLAKDPSWRVRIEVSNVLSNFGDHTPVDVRPPAVPADDQVEPKPVATSAPAGDHPQVAIVTNRGVIVVELFPDVAPYHVDAFLRLVDAGFYNNTQLDRVIPDFVVQGGNPDAGKTTGTGGPGFNVPDEVNPVEQLSGMLSLGLDYKDSSPIFDSAGSQYYITESPQLHLDEYFTTFGRVVKGLAVVYAVEKHDPNDTKTPSDVVSRMYRCEPVTPQTAEIEQQLRTVEVRYNPR
ncbi:MAG: peptidylprolyl isomerase [Candidatus Eremiobacteraeota bacterium]|nr:peptidylprolyl isomerase [Candidatus Eremiobacteraeota bacterium]